MTKTSYTACDLCGKREEDLDIVYQTWYSLIIPLRKNYKKTIDLCSTECLKKYSEMRLLQERTLGMEMSAEEQKMVEGETK